MEIEEVLNSDAVIVDVRSPAEFLEDCIPNAVNIPLLDNDERKIVGTLYSKVGKKEAIDEGFKILQGKLKNFLENYNKFKGRKLIIYCWRGGMRSGSVCKLLNSLGYDADVLDGGYKNYREFVRNKLLEVKIPKLIVVHGLGGSGKTRLLKKFDNFLDLEGLAQHRGSVFGGIGLKPVSQKKFESNLLERLNELINEKFILIEGESRKIGNSEIPLRLWKAMKDGVHILLEVSFDERVKINLEDYGDLDKDELIDAVESISTKLGKNKVVKLIELIKNDIKEFVRLMMKDYYDPLYSHSLKKYDYSYVISCKDDLDKVLEKV